MKLLAFALIAVSISFSECWFDQFTSGLSAKKLVDEYFNVKDKDWKADCPKAEQIDKSDKAANLARATVDFRQAKKDFEKDPSKEQAFKDAQQKFLKTVLPCASDKKVEEAIKFYQNKDKKD